MVYQIFQFLLGICSTMDKSDWQGLFTKCPKVGLQIFGYLSDKDLGACRETCINWQNFEEIAWSRLQLDSSSIFKGHIHPLLVAAFYGLTNIYLKLSSLEDDKNPQSFLGWNLFKI